MKHAGYLGSGLSKHPVSGEEVLPLPQRCRVNEHTLHIEGIGEMCETVPEVLRSFGSRAQNVTSVILSKVNA